MEDRAQVKKYEILRGDPLKFKNPTKGGRFETLYRIISMKDFQTKTGYNVKSGEIGGYISGEQNLSQSDSSWVFNTAKVFGDALLIDSSVHDYALVFGNSIISDSQVRDRCRIWESPTIKESRISGNVDISGRPDIEGCSLHNSSIISGSPKLYGVKMYDGSRITGSPAVKRTVLRDVSEITGGSQVTNCQLSGRSFVKDVRIQNETIDSVIELDIKTKLNG